VTKTERPPLTDFQKQVLKQVHRRSGRTANNIALRAGLPNGQYIGRCLDRLREKGYVEGERGGKWVRARG
jgi:SOS-response transcriptional repressor LexA